MAAVAGLVRRSVGGCDEIVFSRSNVPRLSTVSRSHSRSSPPVQTIHMLRPSISGCENVGRGTVVIHVVEVIGGRQHELFRA